MAIKPTRGVDDFAREFRREAQSSFGTTNESTTTSGLLKRAGELEAERRKEAEHQKHLAEAENLTYRHKEALERGSQQHKHTTETLRYVPPEGEP